MKEVLYTRYNYMGGSAIFPLESGKISFRAQLVFTPEF